MKEKSCERNMDAACQERIMKGGLEYVRSGDYFIPNLTLPSHWQVGTDTSGLSERAQADSVQLPAPVRRTVDIPCRPESAGAGQAGTDNRPDEDSRESDGRIESC